MATLNRSGMFPEQVISERLRETQRFYQSEPPTIFNRIWHIMSGSGSIPVALALISLFISILRFIDFFYFGINIGANPVGILFMTGHFTVVFPLVHAANARGDYASVSESFIATARALEKRVNKSEGDEKLKRMKTMMKITRLSRIPIAILIIESLADLVMILICIFVQSSCRKFTLFPFRENLFLSNLPR